MNRKKIGSRDYSYVVHLYLQEYNRVYTLSRRSIYLSNRRFRLGRRKKSKRKKINRREVFNLIFSLFCIELWISPFPRRFTQIKLRWTFFFWFAKAKTRRNCFFTSASRQNGFPFECWREAFWRKPEWVSRMEALGASHSRLEFLFSKPYWLVITFGSLKILRCTITSLHQSSALESPEGSLNPHRSLMHECYRLSIKLLSLFFPPSPLHSNTFVEGTSSRKLPRVWNQVRCIKV